MNGLFSNNLHRRLWCINKLIRNISLTQTAIKATIVVLALALVGRSTHAVDTFLLTARVTFVVLPDLISWTAD